MNLLSAMTSRSVLVGLLSIICACSQTPDYVGTVRAFQNYKNEGNVESALELFVDKPVLHFGSLGTITGVEGLRNILEYDIALNTHLHFEGCQLTAREVTCRVTEKNDWLRLAGIDSIEYDENSFAFSPDHRIESVVATLSRTSDQRLGAVMAEFHAWGTKHRPLEYGELFSADGDFVYSGENAGKVTALLKAWRGE